LESSYLGAKDPASLRITPKLKLNANDDDFFQLNLAQRKPPQGGLRGLRDSERLLWNCFQFFKGKVEEKFSTMQEGQQVAAFVSEVVTERLVFISVRIQDQLSTYAVFETLNSRGLELTETDLLKNYLLSLADRLSKSQIDPVFRQWARITARVGIASFPEFLRHHLNSHRQYVRQQQLFKTIKRDITTLDDVFALLDRLETDAAWFEGLKDFSSQFWLDYPGAKEQVRVLNLLDLQQNLWVKKCLRALNCSVFLDANRQPSPSGRRKSHDFKRRRPETSVHGFVIALRRARAQSAAADGARARNRLKN
jgi:hypothetical protein